MFGSPSNQEVLLQYCTALHTLVLLLLKFSIKNSALMDFICVIFYFFLTRPLSHLWQHHSTDALMQRQQQHQHQQKKTFKWLCCHNIDPTKC